MDRNSNDRFANDQNLIRFRRLAAGAATASELELVNRLLAEQEEIALRLRELDAPPTSRWLDG
jgi:hypothetical protein